MVKKASKKVKQIKGYVQKWRTYFARNINNYHFMHEFVLGKQWTDEETNTMLNTFRKTALQSNKLGTMANALLGEQQQNTPQLEVVPLTDCDEEVANLREVIVKDLILSTDSKKAYQVAASQAFIGGYGAFGWGTEYSHSMSFEQDIVPFYFKDSTKAYFDVAAEDINKTDGMFAGYISYMSRKKFKEVYGAKIEEKVLEDKSKISATAEYDFKGGVENLTWADKDAIAIINHYERRAEKVKLYKLSNGEIYNQEQMNEIVEKSIRIARENLVAEQLGSDLMMGEEMAQDDMSLSPQNEESIEGAALDENIANDVVTLYVGNEPVAIMETREITAYKVKHYQVAGEYILDETDFPSEHLPIIFVDNNSWYSKDGKQFTRSFFQDAVDIQRYINYLRTQSAHILKISRWDQFIGSKKNVASNDTQQIFSDPYNTKGMLTFDESPTGVIPQQLRPPELSASLLSQYQLAVEDLYTSTGLYPTKMGDQGNEISGAAIDARTRQGSYPTYVSFNSINRAIAAGGTVVNEMIPKVYDSERALTLMLPDKGRKNIVINRQLDEYGEVIENDLRKGTFEVRLKPGPSYEGQKQESLSSLQQILQANPQTFNLIADLYAENLPLPNTIEIKNRLKTLVPPQIIEAGRTGETPQQEPQQPDPQQQADMLQAQIKQAELQLKMRELELKEQELMMKLQNEQLDSELERQRLENERLETAAQLEETKLRYLAETERTQSDAAISHADNLTKILTHLK